MEADDLGQRVELPPQLPLVLRFDDADLLAHAPDVPVEVLDTIRDEFEGSIGSGTLDPSDPEYERKWKLAEPSADERYLTLFGWDAHADLVRRAAIQSMNNSKAPAAGEAR